MLAECVKRMCGLVADDAPGLAVTVRRASPKERPRCGHHSMINSSNLASVVDGLSFQSETLNYKDRQNIQRRRFTRVITPDPGSIHNDI